MRRNDLYFEKKSRNYTPYILALVLAAIIAFVFAFLWQNKEKSTETKISADDKQLVTPEVSEDGKKYEKQTIVPKSEFVNSSYFDDAVFIGDSLTTGIELYGILENTKVLASIGVNVDTIKTTPFIEKDGKTLTVLEALAEEENVNKIYIMLGANGIAWFPKDTLISSYKDFVTSIKELKPDATIYIQSILPVTKAMSDLANNITNEKIDEYNAEIVKMSKELDCYYVDVNSELKDENGALPDYASPSDGMHLTAEYYVKWVDVLKCHTVTEE